MEYIDDPTVIKNVISGTDISAIMGFNPYTTVYDVWMKRKHGKVRKVENQRAKWGVLLEEVVAKNYCDTLDKELPTSIILNKHTLIKPEPITNWFFYGSPDFYIVTPTSGTSTQLVGLEIKTSKKEWPYLPIHYELQCRWYMMLTGLESWIVFSLHLDALKETIYTVDRDAEKERDMCLAASEFVERYLMGDEEPFNITIPESAEEKVVEDKKVDLYVEELNDLKRELDLLEARKNKIEINIKSLIGDHSKVVGAAHSATWKTQTRMSTDINKIIEDYHIEDLSKYQKESNFRVLRTR